ncbi:hypothetical protein BDV19DRAFT_393096 [Aspergillus venezuelensis]
MEAHFRSLHSNYKPKQLRGNFCAGLSGFTALRALCVPLFMLVNFSCTHKIPTKVASHLPPNIESLRLYREMRGSTALRIPQSDLQEELKNVAVWGGEEGRRLKTIYLADNRTALAPDDEGHSRTWSGSGCDGDDNGDDSTDNSSDSDDNEGPGVYIRGSTNPVYRFLNSDDLPISDLVEEAALHGIEVQECGGSCFFFGGAWAGEDEGFEVDLGSCEGFA